VFMGAGLSGQVHREPLKHAGRRTRVERGSGRPRGGVRLGAAEEEELALSLLLALPAVFSHQVRMGQHRLIQHVYLKTGGLGLFGCRSSDCGGGRGVPSW